ncbi:hypothetical protein [Oceaniovalibus sp. ACAM 378]|uniref:hypothetical protein n=1 Tax=Oceaniovalibus sp. ACAM 378 TaxID=2599923 RepID=UPI0011D62F16|nr:hypothetical protein [Oceaniovalibus sp. ACAM 378]TYB90639.1 hypothetical protein FQ320_02990 [Oceaniovalibus sp. ACAM 378]
MSEGVTGADLSRDHVGLTDTLVARRYFRKFEAISSHLARVAAAMESEGIFSRGEVEVLGDYVQRIANTFRALGMKYLMTGRDTGTSFGSLAMDRTESGFPVFRELLTMGSDFAQAAAHLDSTPDREGLTEQMLGRILRDLEIPTRLQFAMAQRVYYETLLAQSLFWAQNDPRAIWLGGVEGRRRFLLHWAVYDTEVNLPVVYLMEIEDSGRVSLPKDAARWPAVQAHLTAQSMGGLKLLTIANGFDRDFDDLHPKRLRRLHIGPMYSRAYTQQSGPIHEILEEAHAPDEQDWCLVWTTEELESGRVERESKGWFGSVEREVFTLDPFGTRGIDTGATRTDRSIILPQLLFQVLSEKNPPGFRSVRKFVVSANGRVLSHR